MEQVLLLSGLCKRGGDTLVPIINLRGTILVKLRSLGGPLKNLIYFVQELEKGFSLDN